MDGRSTTGDGTGGGEAPFLSRDCRTLGGLKRRPSRPLGDAEHMRARLRPATPTCPTASSSAPPRRSRIHRHTENRSRAHSVRPPPS